MSNSELPGKRFAKHFPTDDPEPSILTGFDRRNFAAAKIVHSSPELGVLEIPPQDAFVLAFLLRDFSKSDLWVGGRPTKWQPIRRGEIHYYDLEAGVRANIKEPLNFVFMYLPRSLLDEFTDEHNLERVNGCGVKTGTAIADPTVARLASSLLPALERPEQANQLLTDEVAFKLQAHFVHRYARSHNLQAFFRGGLAPWQERRAKECIRAHLKGTISISQIAAECQLSRSHFFRAFSHTLGKSPYRWLIHSRIEQSRNLLLTSNLSLMEIATACGFSSQSHFTRVFSGYFGVSPGMWRSASRH